MKIKFELDLEDLLTEDFDYYEDTDTLRLKDDSELAETIKDKIVDTVINCIERSFKYSNSLYCEVHKLIKELVTENKQVIIENVIKDVSKKIITNKQIKDFKKSLEEDVIEMISDFRMEDYSGTKYNILKENLDK